MKKKWYSEEEEDDYGSSYNQYGGYNGWNDDVINDAFDYDPSSTWLLFRITTDT